MRRLLPTRVELAIFASLALACTLLVALFQPNTHDLGFAALAGPLFLIAACMGLRKSPVWMRAAGEEDENAAE